MAGPGGDDARPGADDAAPTSFMRRLIDPGPAVVGPAHRRRAKVAAVLLLSLVGLSAIDLAAAFSGLYGPVGLATLAEVGAAAGLIAAFFLARTGRIDAGTTLAIIIVEAVILFFAEGQPHGEAQNTILFYLVVPILLAGLLLNPRVAAAVVFATVVIALGAEQHFHEDAHLHFHAEDFGLALLLVAAGVLAVAASTVHGRDAAQLDRSTAELAAAKRGLEEAAGERGRMFNQIAHDLANPLSPLMLQMVVLEKATAAPPPRTLAIIRKNLDHLNKQIEDLKDLARSEAGHLVLNRTPADLAAIVREAAESFAPRAAEKGIALEIGVPESMPIVGDAGRLNQIFYNLFSNAVKFTPADGRIVVGAGEAGSNVWVAVQDTGRGLEPDEARRLFQPFVQVHGPGEVAERGTGLGLYIVRTIAEAHGGHVGVESAGRGHGSRFTVTLPGTPPGQVGA